MDIQWVKLRSWHALRPDTHFAATTYCGRAAEGFETSAKLPGAKSCELCARIVLRLVDAELSAD